MIQILKKAITVCSLVVLGGTVLYNCEPDIDTLGEQLFLGDAAQGKIDTLDVATFNINNNDYIRSDASKLGYAPLGAFKEGQFGMQRASYLTQLRLSTYNPDFGTDAVVDSVILVIKPTYSTNPDSIKTKTLDEGYTYKTTTDETVNAKEVFTTYPVLKFGKAKKTMHIHVNEVTEFLKGASDSVQSNQNFAYDSNLLGSKEFKGSVSSVAITRDSDGSALFTTTPGIRIPLDKTFFQNKIIAKKGQPELQDASNFIRHVKGLRISVAEDDGYLFQFTPNTMELIMYYKNGTGTTKTPATYSFDLGSANTHIGQYEYDRSGSQYGSAVMGSEDLSVVKLFAQGMGGPSIGVQFSPESVLKLRELNNNAKSAIINAKIRLHIDPSSWKNTYPKPTAFTFLRRVGNDMNVLFTKDLSVYETTLPGFYPYTFNLNNEPAYYDFIVTQEVKDLIEKKTTTQTKESYFRIDLGAFLQDQNQNNKFIGPKNTERAYNIYRAVFVGANQTNKKDPNRAQLLVTYGTK